MTVQKVRIPAMSAHAGCCWSIPHVDSQRQRVPTTSKVPTGEWTWVLVTVIWLRCSITVSSMAVMVWSFRGGHHV